MTETHPDDGPGAAGTGTDPALGGRLPCAAAPGQAHEPGRGHRQRQLLRSALRPARPVRRCRPV